MSRTARASNLTGKIKSVFVNMEDDHPVPERRAYGLAGFTTGEKSVIVYDRFDLWQVDLDGSNPVRLTRGKEDSTVYRCASEGGGGGGGGGGRGGRGAAARGSAPCSLDGEGRTIDTSKPLMLSATGDYNKKSGYAKLTVGQPVAASHVARQERVAVSRKAEERRRLSAARSRRSRSRRTSSSPAPTLATRSRCRTPTRSRATTRGASRS